MPNVKDTRPEFRQIVKQRMEELGFSNARLARELDVGGHLVGDWLKTNRFTRFCFPDLCRVIQIAEYMNVTSIDDSEAEKRFKIDWRRQEKNTSNRPRDELRSRFERTDAKFVRAFPRMKEAAEEITGVIGDMQRGDVLAIWTASVMPMIYRILARPKIAERMRTALESGSLLCVFPPSEVAYRRLAEGFGFRADELLPPSAFLESHANFVAWAERTWAGKGRFSDAADTLASHIGIIPVDDAPWLTPGFTFALFGDYRKERGTAFRAGLRVPDDAFGGCIPVPKYHVFEERLRLTACKHIRDELGATPRGETPHNREFLQNFLDVLQSRHEGLNRSKYF